MADQLLKLTNLSCSRGGIRVLSGVSFGIKRGEAVVLRGPNGSGKTTLLRTIAGLQSPDEGEISTGPDTIAYSAHLDGLKGTLTVSENLEFWAGIFGTIGIDHAVQAFNLSGLQNRLAQSLSAGQKRRLGLARLMVSDRPLWVLDEPTVSLDQQAVILFAKVVQAHLQGGGAALIATHIDLGLEGRDISVSEFKASELKSDSFDEAFL